MNDLRCAKNVVRNHPSRPVAPPRPCVHRPHPVSTALPVQSCGNHRKPSRKFPIRVLKSASFLRRSSTFRIEWMTVEWCLPPKLRPISGSDACVSDLQRYIAICRGIATDFELLRDFRSTILSL